MSKNFRAFLILIGLAIFLVAAYLAALRATSFYNQMNGGQQLDEVLRESTDQSSLEVTCDPVSKGGNQVKEKLEIAINNLNYAVKFHPMNSRAHLLLGRSYCLSEDPEEAKSTSSGIRS